MRKHRASWCVVLYLLAGVALYNPNSYFCYIMQHGHWYQKLIWMASHCHGTFWVH
jgi:hypothetical protein